ncbi:MAG TPA: class I SAM-dependent methyltransferase [Vicinamibacterales bacterium]|jgi:methionine biosynthesis protein MetW|nr:class I SAM-dependent methyltransferase [Vicinamibacterales bacterium]
MKAARAFYEFDAARRVRHDGRDDLIYRRNRRVLDLLPAGARCLDVGCGAGGFAPLLAERFQVVSGVDLSLTLAKAASTRGMRALCADVDEGELPFLDAAFDAIVCCDVLEHVFDPVTFVKRVTRVLRPQGLFIVSVPNIRYWPRVRSLLGGYFPRTTGDPNGYDGGHLHYFASRNVIEVFAAAGLRAVRSYGFNADTSRRAAPVSFALRRPWLEPIAREFGCSTIIVTGQRGPAAAV